MLQLPRQRQGRHARMAKQLARPPAAVTPAESPAASSATAAAPLPAASAILSNVGPARPGGASTTYLPAPATVALAATLAAIS